MWFDSWPGVLRVIAVGASAYVIVVVLLRLTGKRGRSAR